MRHTLINRSISFEHTKHKTIRTRSSKHTNLFTHHTNLVRRIVEIAAARPYHHNNRDRRLGEKQLEIGEIRCHSPRGIPRTEFDQTDAAPRGTAG